MIDNKERKIEWITLVVTDTGDKLFYTSKELKTIFADKSCWNFKNDNQYLTFLKELNSIEDYRSGSIQKIRKLLEQNKDYISEYLEEDLDYCFKESGCWNVSFEVEKLILEGDTNFDKNEFALKNGFQKIDFFDERNYIDLDELIILVEDDLSKIDSNIKGR